MKLRYIILGSSLFAWSAAAAEFLCDYFKIDMIIGRPVLNFVILGAGILIGLGFSKRD